MPGFVSHSASPVPTLTPLRATLPISGPDPSPAPDRILDILYETCNELDDLVDVILRVHPLTSAQFQPLGYLKFVCMQKNVCMWMCACLCACVFVCLRART